MSKMKQGFTVYDFNGDVIVAQGDHRKFTAISDDEENGFKGQPIL